MACLPYGVGGAFLKKLVASFSPPPPLPRGRGRSLVRPFFLSPLRNVGVKALNYWGVACAVM